VLGLGFVVDTSAMDGKRTAKLDIKLKQKAFQEINSEHIKRIVNLLETADLGDMEPERIINMLIDDYKVPQ
jgi:hypothetical protein